MELAAEGDTEIGGRHCYIIRLKPKPEANGQLATKRLSPWAFFPKYYPL